MNLMPQSDNDDAGIPLAPMIDIVFLLLIFFITTSVFARMENELSITVPSAESAEPSQRQLGELIINVKADGSIMVNQKSVTLDQLKILMKRIAKQFPDQSVIIRGDQRTELRHAIHILDTCAQSGVWNVSFAALPPEKNPPAQTGG